MKPTRFLPKASAALRTRDIAAFSPASARVGHSYGRMFVAVLMLLATMTPLGSLAADNAKPWTFWYWMYGAVSPQGIHDDLVAMKDVGLGGCYLMPIRGVADRPEYQGDANQLSPTFWQRIDYAFQQADSLGLDLGLHVCDGFALAGGPWVKPEESMQQVVWTDTIVEGNPRGITLKRPQARLGYYRDIVTLAIPVDDIAPYRKITPKAITCSGGIVQDDKGTYRATTDGSIMYDLGQEKTVRSIVVQPSANNIQAQRFSVWASADGQKYERVMQMEPPRQGWQSGGYDYTYAIRPTRARYFRFSWTPRHTEPGAEDLDAAKWKPALKLRSIVLQGEPKVAQWEGKSGRAWRIAPETTAEELPRELCIDPTRVVRLELEGDKVVGATPHATAKRWRILRMGHTTTGQTNATAGGGKGLEIDKFSPEAAEKLFDNWYALFLARPHADVVKYLHIDSWECGAQNWGHRFAEEFKARRGYDLTPYMPLYAGIPVESAEKSEAVLRDIRQTVSDLVRDVFFKRLYDLAHAHGRQVSHESIAPTFVADGMEHWRNADVTMGEFWLNSPTHDKPNDMLDAISAAHTYGRRIVQAEGFTEVRGVWDETPAMVKPLLDRQWALGMNKLFFHVTAHNPWTDRKPGMTLDGIGLFFQRDNTWFKESRAFVDYITRSQRLLQKGTPVVDIAVFTGEEMPARAVRPEQLVGMLPGIIGRERVEGEARRLANEGQPMAESPVGVRHSAGIVEPGQWVNALRGYHYDSMNRDVLLHGSRVEQGRLVVAGGMSYKVVVVPGATAMDPSGHRRSAALQQRIDELRKAGVIVIDRPFEGETFEAYGLERDAQLPADVAFAHRKTEHEDIYFVANQQNRKRTIEARFRAHGNAWLYNAVTDDTLALGHFAAPGQPLTLQLDAHEAVFVVFRQGDAPMAAMPTPRTDTLVVEPRGWTLSFPNVATPVKSDTLFSWSQHPDPRIRFFSGTTTYTTTFKLNKHRGARLTMQLGEVRDLAHVYLNGHDCGTAWTAPYEVDITQAARRGNNTLRIEVVNTWANALRGWDAGTPPFEGIWTNAKYRRAGKDLLSAGLLGPITITQQR